MFVEYQIKEFIFFNIFCYWFVCVLFFLVLTIYPGCLENQRKTPSELILYLDLPKLHTFCLFYRLEITPVYTALNRLEFILQKWLFRLEPFVPSHWSRSLHILFGYHPHIYSLVSTTHSFGLTVLKAPWTHRVSWTKFFVPNVYSGAIGNVPFWNVPFMERTLS